jgi:hypothetical protein
MPVAAYAIGRRSMQPNALMMVVGIFTSILNCALAQNHQAADPTKKLLVHYMPWYVSKPFSGYWGWHWTMDHYDPETWTDGRRRVASHYYPSIGPYDSGDPDALECHVLLMKFAGIDGIIIDWYGIEDFYDYAIINRNSQRLIEYVERAGLEFAICYEDQSIKHMVEAGHIAEEEAVAHGQAVIKWLQKHCFNSQAYLKVSGRPALFVFGPQYFKGSQWGQLLSVLHKRPFLYVLSHPREGADGVFGWPPVNGTTTTPEQWRGYLTDLYASAGEYTCVGTVFPQFHDIYADAGIRRSYGFLDAQGTKTFESTLDMALRSNCQLIQIVTWNDYGEGTMIEPTIESGYSYLEIIQQHQRENQDGPFPYTADHLRLPVELYRLKKEYQLSRSAMEDLSKCSENLFSGNLPGAEKILRTFREEL